MKFQTNSTMVCKNTEAELRNLLRAAAAEAPTNWSTTPETPASMRNPRRLEDGRDEIIALINTLESKIMAIRSVDDDIFMDKIDGRLRGLLDILDWREKSQHCSTRSLRFR